MLEKFADSKMYLSGSYIVGDDFTLDEIKEWYLEEEEAYCELSGKSQHEYGYKKINNFYGLQKSIIELSQSKNNRILCFGAAYGGEVKEIIKLLEQNGFKQYQITVIDSSSEMLSIVKKELGVQIIKASIDGTINDENDKYDLITCFGVLHHIPNVSFVFSELVRVLKKDGVFLLREPISSMGDWSCKRYGVTINERGLGIDYIAKLIEINHLKIKSKDYMLFPPYLAIANKFNFGMNYIVSIYLDYLFSTVFAFNISYERKGILKKIAPGSIFLILEK